MSHTTSDDACTIQFPSEQDMRNLRPGQSIRVNGKAFRVEGVLRYSALITGPKGGSANLVPSTCGKAIQITRATQTRRQWVRTLEVI